MSLFQVMNFSIKNEPLLKRFLWLDALSGGATAITGLLYFTTLTTVLGFTAPSILTVASINLLYAILALTVALQKPTSVRLLRRLVYANWVWTAISALMIFIYFSSATNIGRSLLLIQPVFVGGLAYLETKQIIDRRATQSRS